MICYHSPVQRNEFHYDLPPELIAQHPSEKRIDARLLVLDPLTRQVVDRQLPDVLKLVNPGDLLIFNDTRVIAARLFGTKQTGGRIEVLVERLLEEGEILAHVKSSKTPRPGSRLTLGDEFPFKIVGREGNLFRLRNESATEMVEIMRRIGHIPLPPYINRADTGHDEERYQTVYARRPGAIAAPTAGLHFDEMLMQQLREDGVQIGFVTLHVGAGTFQPMRCDDIEDHQMHFERFEISAELCRQVETAHAAGNKVIAIGTTSVRALEAVANEGRLQSCDGETDIFIYPGYRFQIVDAMLTNFHLPESTLLMLISAFAGRDNVIFAYEHAIQQRYRFFSYGDAMWISSGLSN